MAAAATDAPVAWVGTAESPDGKADVLEAKLADGQPTRLFLDSATHMPLMMQWQGVPRRGRGGRRGAAAPRGRTRRAMPTAPHGARRQPITMTLVRLQEVNGIKLPHLITRGVNGQTNEDGDHPAIGSTRTSSRTRSPR